MNIFLLIFTARIRRMTGGYVFSLSTFAGGGGRRVRRPGPNAGYSGQVQTGGYHGQVQTGKYPDQVQMGGGYTSQVQVQMGGTPSGPDRGTPHQGWGPNPIRSRWGVPQPCPDGEYPNQVQTGGTMGEIEKALSFSVH